MTFSVPISAGLAALAVGLLPRPLPLLHHHQQGDNAWMMTSTVLVLLMTDPSLALFTTAASSHQNMLSMC